VQKFNHIVECHLIKLAKIIGGSEMPVVVELQPFPVVIAFRAICVSVLYNFKDSIVTINLHPGLLSTCYRRRIYRICLLWFLSWSSHSKIACTVNCICKSRIIYWSILL
jgi:hypothetical protein